MSSRIPRGAAAFALIPLCHLVLAASHTLSAQVGQPPPAVTGMVVDSAGAPLPAVEVVVVGPDRGTTTDPSGRFRIPGIRPGTYDIHATLIGYAPAHAQVVVRSDGSATVDFVLHHSALELPGLSVTASAAASDVLRVAQSTTEVSGEALARALSGSVAGTLAGRPGMAVRYTGPAAALPVIRGFTGERILILQDGERAGDLSSASADHALTVDPLAASRIEVVRGPASLLYGNNALGGVVNVITNTMPSSVPGHVEGYAAVQGETASPGGAFSGGVTVPVSPSLMLTAGGGGRRMDDLRVGGPAIQENTFSRNLQGRVGLGLVGGRSTAGATLRTYWFDYGLPSEPGPAEGGVRLEGRRHDVNSKTTFALGDRAITDLELTATGQLYRHDEVEASGEIGTSFELNTQTVEAMATTRAGVLSGRLGLQGLFRQYDATGEEALTPAANGYGVGVLLFQQLQLRGEHGPSLQFGGRYDYYRTSSETGDPKFGPGRTSSFGSASGSVGVSVPIGAGASLGLSAARAFRAPTVEELFSNAVHEAVGAYQLGTPDLTAETNAGFDAVLRVQRSRVSAEASGYYNRVNEYIAPLTVGDTLVDGEILPLDVFQQADARVYGVEGSLDVELWRGLVLGVMGDRVRGDFLDGGPLPYMPASRVGASARWDDGRLSVSLDARHAFPQERVAENEVATDAYTLVVAGVGTTFVAGGRVHTVMLRLDNALDEEYREATSRIKEFALNPGRNLSLLYRVLF